MIAKPFQRTCRNIAKQFYMQLKEGFEVFPTAADSIQIEYEDENEYINLKFMWMVELKCIEKKRDKGVCSYGISFNYFRCHFCSFL